MWNKSFEFSCFRLQSKSGADVFVSRLAGRVEDRCVYDFRSWCCQFDTLQTRMDARGVFTTLIAQNT
jgi:hypothetical protein